MAQGSEPFHVPQQDRKNKLRVTTTTQANFQEQQSLMNTSPSSLFSSPQNLNKDLNYLPFTSSSKGLSLSLSSQLESRSQRPAQNSVSVLENFLKNDTEVRSSVPLGPFTGYASILKSSRFLKPAQQILEDLFCVANCGNLYSTSMEFSRESEAMRESISVCSGIDYDWRNSKLILMLEEVYRRYKLYCQQMQSVVASFETVAGLGNAAPYICYAIKLFSKNFTCLKNALLDQIQSTTKTSDNDGSVIKGNAQKFLAADEIFQNQNLAPISSILPNPVWRSQRGLPEQAVAVLKTWLFEHFLHPYPTDSEKQILAQQTGLSRTQVSNWFINARVRLWKPMVEEVHSLESQQTKVLPSEAAAATASKQNRNMKSDFSLQKLRQTVQQQKADHIQNKRPRNELLEASKQRQQQRTVHFEYPSSNCSSDVSLALGLHQNNVVDLSWPLSTNMPHHTSTTDLASATNSRSENQHLRQV